MQSSRGRRRVSTSQLFTTEASSKGARGGSLPLKYFGAIGWGRSSVYFVFLLLSFVTVGAGDIVLALWTEQARAQ